MSESSPSSAKPASSAATQRALLYLVVVIFVLAIWGVTTRVLSRTALAEQAAKDSVPVVKTLRPSPNPSSELLLLPATVQAYSDALIYARTSGYLKAWHSDIGSHVKKGALLAEIDTPEIDQELKQAQAALESAKANAELADSTTTRWQALLATQSVSPQDADNKSADASAKRGAYAAAKANVARLRDLESFKRVTAPFDGIVTQRNTDVGALITAGQNPSAPLFQVSDIHKLRIYVTASEAYARAMLVGTKAEVHFNTLPGRSFPTQIVRTAEALDSATRTLQVELELDNHAGNFLRGAYAEVAFHIPVDPHALQIPATALMFRSAGLQVATVDSNSTVRFHKITVARDFGKMLEVVAGLTAGDVLITDPPDSLMEGSLVRIAPSRAADVTASKNGSNQ